MSKFTLRNRIAIFYSAVTALLAAVTFLIIYLVVQNTVYNHLNSDLNAETKEVYSSIVVINDTLLFANRGEWNENEHDQVEVNPTFIQVILPNGEVQKKSNNLRENELTIQKNIRSAKYFNTILNNAEVRQLQTPIVNSKREIIAYLVVAIPLKESLLVLNNLINVLFILYPIFIVLLFLLSRAIAGKSISPINNVIETASKIDDKNLDFRIDLPLNKDEIYTLTETINNLLDRLHDSVLREKQFIADASHELRTPLSVIKGTLEVLVRKPRTQEQYEEKINYVSQEVDRISLLIEQLLTIARYDNEKVQLNITKIELNKVFDNVLERLAQTIADKNINIIRNISENQNISADTKMLEIMLENIISNSLKYSKDNTSIKIEYERNENTNLLKISDEGIGISETQLNRIFDRFYRADESRNSKISGMGLGLSIVKKLADLQKFSLKIDSEENKGTTVQIIFPN